MWKMPLWMGTMHYLDSKYTQLSLLSLIISDIPGLHFIYYSPSYYPCNIDSPPHLAHFFWLHSQWPQRAAGVEMPVSGLELGNSQNDILYPDYRGQSLWRKCVLWRVDTMELYLIEFPVLRSVSKSPGWQSH